MGKELNKAAKEYGDDLSHDSCEMAFLDGADYTRQWKPIPKDKDGFFDKTSDLYEQLPIIVADIDREMVFVVYVDKDNWLDYVSDFNHPYTKYYLPCGELRKEANNG